jgi:shikimate kinase
MTLADGKRNFNGKPEGKIEFRLAIRHKGILMPIPSDTQTADLILSRLDRPIVLIGMMGAGKSRLARMLGDTLDLPVADSDEEIEKAAGCSIAEIFERYGEPFFRDRERRVIERLIGKKRGIIATGGGAVMQPETAETVWNHTVSIWVRADLSVLIERTGRNANRPLLKNGDPAQILTELSRARDPVYAEADITVDSHNGPAVAILNNTLQKLEYFLMTGRRENGKRKGIAE